MDDQTFNGVPLGLDNMDPELLSDLLSSSFPRPLGFRSPADRAKALLELLPTIDEKRLTELEQRDGSCSICLQPFLSILAEQETAEAMDSPTHAMHELGVSQLNQSYQCGHLFCRKDLVNWIKESKDTCPMCRKTIFDPSLPVEDQPQIMVNNATQRLVDYYQNLGFEVVLPPGQSVRRPNWRQEEEVEQLRDRPMDNYNFEGGNGMYS